MRILLGIGKREHFHNWYDSLGGIFSNPAQHITDKRWKRQEDPQRKQEPPKSREYMEPVTSINLANFCQNAAFAFTTMVGSLNKSLHDTGRESCQST